MILQKIIDPNKPIMVDREVASDASLSFEAVGLYCFMCYADDKGVSFPHILYGEKEGYEKAKNELISKGYIHETPC